MSIVRPDLRGPLAATIVIALSSCSGPRPVATPLGWGPLTPSMRVEGDAERSAGRHRPKTGSTDTRTAQVTSASDGGAPSPAKSVEAVREEKPPPETHKEKGAEPAKSGIAASAFVGDYGGEDIATYRIDGLPDRVERDPNAKLSVKSSAEHTVELVLVDSSNGKDICTLAGTTADQIATIAPGQKCFEENGTDATVSATITRGSASLEKTHLVLDLDLDFHMQEADQNLSGTLVYHFDGVRR